MKLEIIKYVHKCISWFAFLTLTYKETTLEKCSDDNLD